MTDHLPPDMLEQDARFLDLARDLRTRALPSLNRTTRESEHYYPTAIQSGCASAIADQIEAYLAERYLQTKGTSE